LEYCCCTSSNPTVSHIGDPDEEQKSECRRLRTAPRENTPTGRPCAFRPGLWFAQAEAQFALASVTSEKKKFNYVISQLEYRHAAGVEDKIIGAPRWPPAHLPSETTIFP